MLSREQFFLLCGGVIAAIALGGLAWYAPAIGDVFELTLAAPPGDADSAAQRDQTASEFTRISLLAVLLGTGLLLTCIGLASQGARGWLSPAGRAAAAIAGIGLAAGAVVACVGLWGMLNGFVVIAMSEVAVKPAELREGIAVNAGSVRWGFAVAMAAQLLFLATVPARVWLPADACQRRSGGWLAAMANIVAIAGFTLTMLIAAASGATVLEMASSGPIKPSDVGGYLMRLLRFGLIAGVFLFVAGATQALCGGALPCSRRASD